jgi:hypothetical protein
MPNLIWFIVAYNFFSIQLQHERQNLKSHPENHIREILISTGTRYLLLACMLFQQSLALNYGLTKHARRTTRF